MFAPKIQILGSHAEALFALRVTATKGGEKARLSPPFVRFKSCVHGSSQKARAIASGCSIASLPMPNSLTMASGLCAQGSESPKWVLEGRQVLVLARQWRFKSSYPTKHPTSSVAGLTPCGGWPCISLCKNARISDHSASQSPRSVTRKAGRACGKLPDLAASNSLDKFLGITFALSAR